MEVRKMKSVELSKMSPIAVMAIIAIVFFGIFSCKDGGDDGGLPGPCGGLAEAICTRSVECDIDPSFSECIETPFIEQILDCVEILGTTLDECIVDLADFDCDALAEDEFPETCEELMIVIPPPVGGCAVCQGDEDCPADLKCFGCFEDCTGEVMRCSDSEFFIECEDGIF
jgi:hypothetical protein